MLVLMLEIFFDKSTKEYREWIEIMESPLVYISQMNKPVIAQVHGPAVANGLGVVAACDLAIASKKLKVWANCNKCRIKLCWTCNPGSKIHWEKEIFRASFSWKHNRCRRGSKK